MFKFELGIVAKCLITQYTGRVTCRSENLNGCIRYYVQAPVDKDGKVPEGYWFDESSLVALEAIEKLPHHEVRTGGPMGRTK